MLKSIYIKNYAIIDEIRLDLESGFIILTGETGAGKSIIMGAIDLILGGRSSSSVINQNKGNTVLEVEFSELKTLPSELKAQWEIEADELTIRRVINTSGKSRSFVNDIPVSLQQLGQLKEYLIDIHRQFDNSWLFAKERQLLMLDVLAGQITLAETYGSQYKEWLEAKNELQKLEAEQSRLLQERDFMKFQYDELSGAELDDLSIEQLEQKQNNLSNVEEIKESLSKSIYQIAENENCLVDQIRSIVQDIESTPISEDQKKAWVQTASNSLEELREMSVQMEDALSETEANPNALAELTDQLDVLYRLQKKHNVIAVSELIDLRDSWGEELLNLEQSGDRLSVKKTEIASIEKSLREKANSLSEGRQKITKSFAENIVKSLDHLSMPNARFVIELQVTDELNAQGMNKSEFLFSANLGQRLQDFKKIASGGEQSRLALCIKAAVASQLDMPTLVFDEIDAGVSGDVALRMGQVLKKLSLSHQLICITHSPQIAAQGTQHFFIYKEDQSDMTNTHMRQLSPKERITEIAKMLSSDPPSASAIANAKDLLGKQ